MSITPPRFFFSSFIYGVPWIIMAQLIAEMIFVGLTSWQPYSDSDREWFGRSTGWFGGRRLMLVCRDVPGARRGRIRALARRRIYLGKIQQRDPCGCVGPVQHGDGQELKVLARGGRQVAILDGMGAAARRYSVPDLSRHRGFRRDGSPDVRARACLQLADDDRPTLAAQFGLAAEGRLSSAARTFMADVGIMAVVIVALFAWRA